MGGREGGRGRKRGREGEGGTEGEERGGKEAIRKGRKK